MPEEENVDYIKLIRDGASRISKELQTQNMISSWTESTLPYLVNTSKLGAFGSRVTLGRLAQGHLTEAYCGLADFNHINFRKDSAAFDLATEHSINGTFKNQGDLLSGKQMAGFMDSLLKAVQDRSIDAKGGSTNEAVIALLASTLHHAQVMEDTKKAFEDLSKFQAMSVSDEARQILTNAGYDFNIFRDLAQNESAPDSTNTAGALRGGDVRSIGLENLTKDGLKGVQKVASQCRSYFMAPIVKSLVVNPATFDRSALNNPELLNLIAEEGESLNHLVSRAQEYANEILSFLPKRPNVDSSQEEKDAFANLANRVTNEIVFEGGFDGDKTQIERAKTYLTASGKPEVTEILVNNNTRFFTEEERVKYFSTEDKNGNPIPAVAVESYYLFDMNNTCVSLSSLTFNDESGLPLCCSGIMNKEAVEDINTRIIKALMNGRDIPTNLVTLGMDEDVGTKHVVSGNILTDRIYNTLSQNQGKKLNEETVRDLNLANAPTLPTIGYNGNYYKNLSALESHRISAKIEWGKAKGRDMEGQIRRHEERKAQEEAERRAEEEARRREEEEARRAEEEKRAKKEEKEAQKKAIENKDPKAVKDFYSDKEISFKSRLEKDGSVLTTLFKGLKREDLRDGNANDLLYRTKIVKEIMAKGVTSIEEADIRTTTDLNSLVKTYILAYGLDRVIKELKDVRRECETEDGTKYTDMSTPFDDVISQMRLERGEEILHNKFPNDKTPQNASELNGVVDGLVSSQMQNDVVAAAGRLYGMSVPSREEEGLYYFKPLKNDDMKALEILAEEKAAEEASEE